MLSCIAANGRRGGTMWKNGLPQALQGWMTQSMDGIPTWNNIDRSDDLVMVMSSRGITCSASVWRRLKSPLPPRSERPQVGYQRRHTQGEESPPSSSSSNATMDATMDSEARERRVAKEEPTSSKDFEEEAMSQQQRPDLVERYMSLEMGSRKDRTRATLQEVAKEFARFPGDTGSSDVQVALLTSKIALLAEHVKAHPKDHSSRRGLRAMLHGRRQLLQYLRRTQFDRYAKVISRLGLKDSFGPQDRFTQRYS
ncbi:30S ribosomal protein S15 [Picochlorum sp. SENEW3]|nr:30S ribosomal protein S15 [Picochlorum sp. SENEW3]